jgi:ADP-ribosyl-[dinitrogen reductase] hydrolase
MHEKATRASWKTTPRPQRTIELPLDITLDAEEMERLRYGVVPQDMDDRWFAFFADGSLQLHRSWTGNWIASVEFRPIERGSRAIKAEVSRETSQYNSAGIEEDARLLRDVIRMIIAGNEGFIEWRTRSPAVGRAALGALVSEGGIRMRGSDALRHSPPPLPPNFDFDRVEGMLLGLAIGDALGNTTESLPPKERRKSYGEITDYLPNPHVEGRAVGLPSDDTQLAFWSLEQIVADGGLDPERLARRLSCQRIFGIGQTVRRFIQNYSKRESSWQTAGVESAGNGALMRIAPVILPHLGEPSAALWTDAAIAAMITHNDFASNASCVAFVDLLWNALACSTPPPAGSWVARFVAIARPLEGGNVLEPRFGAWLGRFRGPLSDFVERAVPAAIVAGHSTLAACDSWGSGAYLLETVPSVLLILERHGHDPREAILRAVNDTRDNDSIAAIVGAAVGALHGRCGLPREWIERLLGRTSENDDGYVFDLIAEARRRFWDKETRNV